MYKGKDYIQRGSLLLRNKFFPRKRRISTLMIYATDLCDSACKHCLIWKKRPVTYLPKEKIFQIMESPAINRKTKVGLEGGEFLLHPEAKEIMAWFHKNHPNFDLLSNCLKPKNTIEAVKAYPPIHLYLSLDGNRETYQNMRGKDGYERVIEVIEALKSTVPISVMFCLSPWNSLEDLQHVAEVCKKHEVDLRVGVYSNIKFFDTQEEAYREEINQKVPAILKEFSENYEYLLLYNEWKQGNLILPCSSIYDSVIVLPNGDVPICMNLDLKLGNVHQQRLEEIMSSKSTLATLKDHHDNCNGCWINFHRKYDLILYRNLERFFPRKAIHKLFGYYQWTDGAKIKYKKALEELE